MQSRLDFTNFIRDFAVDALNPDQQAFSLDRIMKIVHARVSLRLSRSITEDEKRRLEDAEKRGGAEAVLDELDKIRPDYDKLYQEELDQLHQEMLGVIQKTASQETRDA
jgi:predicted outer membrane protein